MYALKTPSFLRPTSRPTSPSPAPTATRTDAAATPSDRTARPLSKLSSFNFKRTASPLTRPSTSLVHDGSYMEVLGLRLSEAVSKALAQPTGPAPPNELLGGRRPIPAGRGRALGEFIATEIGSARENPHLSRAVIRTLHRPLSVLVTNLSGNLLPLIASPAFLSPAVPTPQNPNPNATQAHALALATFAGELIEVFDELGLGQDGDMRGGGDGLKSVRDSLVSTIKRVIDPLVAGIKNDLMPHVEALEQATPNTTAKPAIGVAKVPTIHPSIAYIQAVMPVYARALTRYITSHTAESTLASLLISLVWRGLVALSNRAVPPPGATPPGSPPLGPLSKNVRDAKRRGSSTTPPATPPAGRFTLKLPPSRPPSPPGTVMKGPSVAVDARAFYDLLNTLPRPSSDQLAREAVSDAFESLGGMVVLLDFVYSRRAYTMTASELAREFDRLTVDISTLIALPVLLKAFVSSHGTLPERAVADMLGLTGATYRSGCLSGFGRAEECVPAVGQRVLAVLRGELAAADVADTTPEAVAKWLERELTVALADQQQH